MMKHMTWKKAASLFLSFIMILALVPMASAASPSDFTDFPTGWSKEAVTAAVANGLLNGRSADKIEPQGKLTRAEMATIINRAFGATVEADISAYTDLAPEAWYYREIAKAVNMGTFQGDGDNTMRPDASITREEVFTVIARALVLESEDYSSLAKFNDADAVSDWAKPYASILVAKKYVNGDDLGNLNPRSDITREEFAQIMHNIIKTYYVTSGKHDTVGADSALIRTGGVTLRNVTIEGDLILGDGVGKGNVTLENVIIKGRLLARGGEGRVRLINTSVGESVVVKDVNGIVNFHNYRGEKPFTNLIEITKATFLSTSSGGGSSSGGGGDTTKYVTYTVTHFAEDPEGEETVNGVTYKVAETKTLKAKEGSAVTVPEAISIPGYTLDTTIGYGDRVGTEIPVEKDLEINLYYNLNRYTITITLPDGTKQELEYKHGEKFADHFNITAYPNSKFYYIPEGETEPVELKADTPITGAINITTTTAFIVEFHSNDGADESYPVNTFYGAVLSDIAPSLNREGYRLDSWNTKADGTGTAYATDAVMTEPLTLYAQWKVVPYEITYHSDVAFKDGTDIPYLYDVEKEVVLPKADAFAEYPGYHFGGWYKEPDFINKVESTANSTGALVLYARWLKDDIVYRNVTFHLNYTDAPAATAVQVENGKTVSKPQVPERKGYTFLGWYTDAAGNTAYNFSQAVTEDFVLYAKWNIDTYEIKYELNGGSFKDSNYPTKYTVESLPLTLPENVTYTGKTFGGWFKDAALTVRVTSIPTGTTGEFKVYAKWTDNIYTVTVKTPGETDKTYHFVHGQTVKEVITKEPVRIGYTFAGYNTKEDGTGTTYGENDAITANTVLYTRWNINHYDVEYELNGGVKKNASAFVNSYTVNDAFNLPVASDFEAREGYTFGGWYTNEAFTGEAVTKISAGTTGGKKFYAKWEAVSYSIAYELNGGVKKNEAAFVASYTVADTVTLPTAADFEPMTGYTFSGWYASETFAGSVVTTIPANSTGDKKFYAKWEKNTYTVTFNVDGTESTASYTHGDTIGSKMPDPVKEGYEFLYWSDSEGEGGKQYTADSTIDASVTLHAKWKINNYTVTYVLGDGYAFADNFTPVSSFTVETETFDLPTAANIKPSDTHYFHSWYIMKDGQKRTLTAIEKGTAEDITVYAEWLEKEIVYYNVIFNYNYENAPQSGIFSTIPVKENTAVSKPADPERKGYSFLGWFSDEAGSTAYDFSAPVTKEITLYAAWSLSTYGITYELNGGTKVNEDKFPAEYTVEKEITLPTSADIAKTGYEFKGWYENAEFVGTSVTKIPAGTTDAKVYYAKWEIINYSIKYEAGNGVIKNPAAFEENYDVTKDITLPTATDFEEIPGYTFRGWFDNAEFTGEPVTVIPAGTVGDKTYHAKWEKISYSITYELNNGVKKNESAFVGSYTVTDTVTLPSAADFEDMVGYEFKGWFDNPSFNGSVTTEISAGSTQNKTFYAKWEKLSYTITYETNGGVRKNEDAFVSKYTVTDEIILPVAADFEVREGYTFLGWYDNAAFTGNIITSIPANSIGNKTFYAKWNKDAYSITYELNGGVKKNENAFVSEYTVTDEIKLPVATDFEAMTGYSFVGWYDNAEFTGDAVTSVPAGAVGNKTFYAKWEKISYTITYETNGGVRKNEDAFVSKYTVTDEIVLPVATDFEAKEGYNFLGWYDNAEFTGNAVASIPANSTGNKTFYAKWSKDAYGITYELNGGVKKNENAFVFEYTVTDEIKLPVAADMEAPTGYTFVGWYDNAEFTGNAVTSIPANSTGNKAFYAKWEQNKYTVTFNIDGKTETKEYVHGATIDSQLEEPVKDGYFFTGWNTKEDGTGTAYAHTATVTQAVTLYAQWQEITADTYTVTFYDGVVEDEYMVIGTSDVVQGSKMSQEQIDTALDGFDPYSYDGYKDGSYVHKIFPELWYIAADGTWQIFNDTVPVTSDMNVYYAFKNLSLFFDLKFGDLEMAQPVQFSVPYETDTRILDSIKDALTLGRNQINLALNVDDVYMDAIAKGATTFGDIIDANGNIKYIGVDAALSDIISANEVDGEIKEYIEMLIVENTDAAKVDSIFTHAIGSNLVDNVILGGAPYDHALVEAYINALSEEERIQLADQLHSYLAQEPFYREFIDAYAQDHADFHVTHESIDLIMAVATAVNDYTYDELKDRIYNKFGSVIKLLGDEAAEDFLRDAQDRYYAGALAVWEDLHAHEDQLAYESSYPAYLTFKVNAIEHLFRPVYTEGRTKLISKLQTNAIYRYNENPYLRQMMEELDTDTLIADLFYTVPKTEDNIGYALWPSTATESGFLHYYDYMLEKLILFDKAMLWYEENLTAEEMEVLKNKILEDAATFINKTNELITAYETDGSLPLGLNINDLKQYDAFNKIFSKVEGKITQVINKYKGTPFYGKVWDANSLKNDISYTNEAVDVLLGLDDPTFNVDSLMNKDNIFNKLGFTDYTYGDDEALGTVTVQAIQRIFRESTIKTRRYFQ